MVRIILYIFFVPISVWALDAVNITNLFKKNRFLQARILYLLLVMSLSYLSVNFLMDFFLSTQSI